MPYTDRVILIVSFVSEEDQWNVLEYKCAETGRMKIGEQ